MYKSKKKQRERKRKREINKCLTFHSDERGISTDSFISFAGMIGALPPGAMHPAFAAPMGFPGAPMLAPMMHPRFR